MEHLHSRLPYAQWRLQVFRRLFLTSDIPNSSFLARRAHTSSNNAVQPDSNTTKTDSKKSMKSDIAADSTIPPSQHLPQSPLLTNPRPGCEIRHRKKRLPTNEELLQYANNPWAMAMASPMRMCNATSLRLPKAFLTEWGLVEEPDSAPEPEPETELDGEPGVEPDAEAEVEAEATTPARGKNGNPYNNNKLWVLPRGLLEDYLHLPASEDQDMDKGTRKPGAHLAFRMIDRKHMYEKITKVAGEPPKKRTRYQKGMGPWMVAPLFPFRWRAPMGPLTGHDIERLFWRTDMPEFVLKMKRRDALKRLKLASDKQNTLWRPFDVQEPYSGEALLQGLMMEAIRKKERLSRMETGVFLVLGDSSVAGAEVEGMPNFITHPQNGTKVAVLNLTRLFSQVELDEIRAYHERFRKFGVFVRPSEHVGVDAILALWNLNEYLRTA